MFQFLGSLVFGMGKGFVQMVSSEPFGFRFF
ncbi:MAG: hypothetical protein LASZOEIN_002710 [Candidatus Fervidibacter sp.]|jgi:hypothetical protein